MIKNEYCELTNIYKHLENRRGRIVRPLLLLNEMTIMRFE